MSELRRRLVGEPSPTPPTREPTPDPHEDSQLVSLQRLRDLKSRPKAPTSKRRIGFIFALGGIIGVFAALFFAHRQDVISFEGMLDLNLDNLFEALPAQIVKDAKDITKHERDAVDYDSFSVGLHIQSQGISAKHPVIMVPGVISTGLESWGTESHSRQYFRKRLWGSWTMMRALITDQANWKRHVMLDKTTGMDPPGIKLRAAQGFDATDFFITGYWIWNKVLENLAAIGYSPANAFTAAYDWRLSYDKLEERDNYFTRLKSYIEVAVQTSDEKVVLISHSMGSQVVFYFLAWVEAEGHGNGGPDWVDRHIGAWVNISGCMLGALKDLPAMLSGEMRDTAQLNSFAVYGLEKFLAREERAEIFRAMPGVSSMLPKGGNAVWGNSTWAPDDRPGQNVSYGTFINFRAGNSSSSLQRNLTVEESLPFLFHNTDDWYEDLVRHAYSHGVAETSDEVEANMRDPRKWVNPLEARLPKAPNMRLYCFYGVGKETERSYFYKEYLNPLSSLNVTIDTAVSSDGAVSGVTPGEGDGTVNLLSTGYMCAKGWHLRRFNPAGVKVTVYEMPHEPDRFSPRGGPNTGDHVDILGRASLNDLILRVAGGKGHLIEDNFVTNIRDYAEKVKVYEET